MSSKVVSGSKMILRFVVGIERLEQQPPLWWNKKPEEISTRHRQCVAALGKQEKNCMHACILEPISKDTFYFFLVFMGKTLNVTSLHVSADMQVVGFDLYYYFSVPSKKETYDKT